MSASIHGDSLRVLEHPEHAFDDPVRAAQPIAVNAA